jgi:hypothetical protein
MTISSAIVESSSSCLVTMYGGVAEPSPIRADQAKARRQAPAAAPVEPGVGVGVGGVLLFNTAIIVRPPARWQTGELQLSLIALAGARDRPIRPALVVAGYFSGFSFALCIKY